jgi:hypothetical protein
MWCKEGERAVLIARIFVVSVFGLALTTAALAQTTPAKPTAPATPAEPTTPSSSLQGVREAHPDWFTSRKPYRPCPSSVAFNGRGACLGCPTTCPTHF